jgi:hypothetical protein
MGKVSQTGLYQNRANFFSLYGMVKAHGAAWTPNDAKLSEPKILEKNNDLNTIFGEFEQQGMSMVLKIDHRGEGMITVNPLMTRVKNEVLACDVSDSFKADVVSRVKKIQGVRISPKIKMEPGTVNVPSEEGLKQISAAQTGVDDKLGHVGELITLLDGEPGYTTQIDALKVVNLKIWHGDLKERNEAVKLQHGVVLVKRNDRNKAMYDAKTGSNELASKIKKTFKSIFGGASIEYKQAAKLKFTKPKGVV